MYITTDSRSPGSAPYLPGLFSFYIPELGTGLKFLDNGKYPPCPNCTGCDEAYARIAEINTNFQAEVNHQALIYGSELLVFIGIIFIPIIIFLIGLLIYALRQYDPSAYPDKDNYKARDIIHQSSMWEDLFANINSDKKQKSKNRQSVVGSIPSSNFEDNRF